MIKNYKNQLIGAGFFAASMVLYFATDNDMIHTISGVLSAIAFCYVFKIIPFVKKSPN
ncbi:hypothetical protein [Tenacibaculum xiamenense]|uniref:hypothetical protein n=1 Tax=Tenacibaculum xiamenense TaxID=1261553 RepID=UPI003894A967